MYSLIHQIPYAISLIKAKGGVTCHEKNPKSVKTTFDVEEWKTRRGKKWQQHIKIKRGN